MKRLDLIFTAIWGGFLMVLLGIFFDSIFVFVTGFVVYTLGYVCDNFIDLKKNKKKDEN